jgi:endonuclease YncB( thermonuclease family)
VLNDGTRADVILERVDSSFLPVQLKTSEKRLSRNHHTFQNITGYSGMPVVCWRIDKDDAYVFDGDTLNTRGKSNITVGTRCKSNNISLARALSIDSLIIFLEQNAASWTTTQEHKARHDLTSSTQRMELRGIDTYCERFPGNYSWPMAQNSHVDLFDGNMRMQFKTVSIVKGAGFRCNMTTSAGRDRVGRALRAPYQHDDFDVLVAVWISPSGTPHFWRIPTEVLFAHGILSNETCRGKTCFYVHGPNGVGNAPNKSASRRVDMWTLMYYAK